MVRRKIILLAFLLVPAAASGEDQRISELDCYVASAREAWEVPGLAVAIVKDGEVILAKGYGVREAGRPEVVDEQTAFAIASNTKAFTAAALAMLKQDGKLDWKDRVQDHLPYFRLYDPYVSAEMRVEDLLCHRSGLGTFSGDLLWYGTLYSPKEILLRTRDLPATGSFRAHYGYSNLMFLAAGEIVAKAGGKPWPEFVRERILQPLEMNRTVISITKLDELGNVATPHKTRLDGNQPLDWYNWDAMAAAGGIVSSVSDMAKWLRFQLDMGRLDEKRSLLERDAFDRMWSPQTIIPLSQVSRIQYPTTHFRAYGLGWSLADYKGRKTVGHGGGYDGMYSRVVMVPEEKLGVVVLTNSMTGISTALANRVVDTYLGGGELKDWAASGLERDRKNRRQFYERIEKATTAVAEDTQPRLPLDAYAGTYRSKLYGDATVGVEDGKLVLRLLPNKDLVADLGHLHYDTFVVRWRNEFAWFAEGTGQFVLNSVGKVTELKLDIPNDDLWFDELELIRTR